MDDIVGMKILNHLQKSAYDLSIRRENWVQIIKIVIQQLQWIKVVMYISVQKSLLLNKAAFICSEIQLIIITI